MEEQAQAQVGWGPQRDCGGVGEQSRDEDKKTPRQIRLSPLSDEGRALAKGILSKSLLL